MKDFINLLPPDVKVSRVRTLYIQHCQRIVNWALGLFGSFAILLVVAWVGFGWLTAQLAGSAPPASPSTTANHAAVATINTFARAFTERVTSTTTWTTLIAAMLQVMPPEVRLTSLELQVIAGAPQVNAKGVADDANYVVTWRRALQALSSVSSVEAPLDNFATTQRGEFRLTIHLATPKPTPL